MEDSRKSEGAIPDAAEAMKQKYGKVYKVGVTVPVDDEDEQEMTALRTSPFVMVGAVVAKA